jgi:hypothetical protein
MNADNEEAVHSGWPEAKPTENALLHIVMTPVRKAADAPPGVVVHAPGLVVHVNPLRRFLRLPRPAPDNSHGKMADRPGDAVLAALYLAAEQTPPPGDPSYDVDQGLQRFSTWLDDQIEQ